MGFCTSMGISRSPMSRTRLPWLQCMTKASFSSCSKMHVQVAVTCTSQVIIPRRSLFRRLSPMQFIDQ